MEQTKNKKEKLGFFKRLKKAIFELEDYGFFLGEKLGVAFKYFFTLAFLVSVILSVAITFNLGKRYNVAYDYIKNELPDFKLENNVLDFNEVINAYDHEYKFRLIIDTKDVYDEKINEYKNAIYATENGGLILLKEKMVVIANDTESQTTYKDIITVAPLEGENTENTPMIEITNKASLIETIDNIGITNLLLIIFFLLIIVVYILNLMVLLSDVCVVAIFGWFASRICGVGFKMNPMIALSIYGLSLSIILDLIVDIIWITTGFMIEYFNVIYLLIAYVYIIAAIFMIKYDLIKHTQELQKILEVQKQVKIEKISEDKSEENEDSKEESKEENDDKENEPKETTSPEEDASKEAENKDPDGSEI